MKGLRWIKATLLMAGFNAGKYEVWAMCEDLLHDICNWMVGLSKNHLISAQYSQINFTILHPPSFILLSFLVLPIWDRMSVLWLGVVRIDELL